MKVVYFYRGVPVSTPAMHIRFIISALQEQGHEVVECFPAAGKSSGISSTPTRLARAKAWYRAFMPRSLVNLAQIYEARAARHPLLELCLRERPEFIYERYSIFTDAGLRAAKAIGCPLIQEVNAVYSWQHREVFAPGFLSLARRADRTLLPQADALIAVSDEVANALKQCGVPAEKITVMHNAIDPGEYFGLAEKRDAVRGSLGLTEAFVIIVLQALDSGPFPAALLRAIKIGWPRVRAQALTARILWIGGGSTFQWFRERVYAEVPGSENEILFVGSKPHSEVPVLLACGDLGLVPWHRSFCSPMKVFEYMAAGLPVVAPRLEGIQEVVCDGDTGLLFPHEDFETMAKQILSLAADRKKASTLGKRAREYVMREHTWAKNASQIIEIYQRLTGERE